MPVDRVRCLKLEAISEGGGQTDDTLTETNIGQDYLDALGLCLQLAGATVSTSDAAVNLSRASDSALQFQDSTSGTLKLSQLLTGVLSKPGTHAAVLDFSHWLGAPGDGFASGVFRQTLLTGLLPSSITWYASNQLTTKLFATAFSYTGVLCTQKVHTLYSNNAAVRTLTETFSYAASLFAPAVTRTWA